MVRASHASMVGRSHGTDDATRPATLSRSRAGSTTQSPCAVPGTTPSPSPNPQTRSATKPKATDRRIELRRGAYTTSIVADRHRPFPERPGRRRAGLRDATLGPQCCVALPPEVVIVRVEVCGARSDQPIGRTSFRSRRRRVLAATSSAIGCRLVSSSRRSIRERGRPQWSAD